MGNFLIFLGLLAVIILPVVLITMTSGLKQQLEILSLRIAQLSQDVKNITKPPASANVQPEIPPVETATLPYEATDNQTCIDTCAAEEETVAEPTPDPEIEIRAEEILAPEEIEQPVLEPETEEHPAEHEPEPAEIIRPDTAPFREFPKPTHANDINLERFIGENLINKIGIGVLVIGIGLFVRYAIDNNWLGEIGRVIIGFLSGGLLLALAYRFRDAYRAFSSVLAGGASVVFYFTVAIAFREYGLFNQAVAFLMMVAVTAFSVWLSIRYNRRELAILSLAGGMLTPFMVSRGDGNYHVLFTYIALLNVGMLTLSLRRQWKELLIISFAGTQLIFWTYFLRDARLFNDAIINIARDSSLLLYASIFYIIFLLMPLIQVFRSKEETKDHTLHVIMLIANSFFISLAGTLLLQRMEFQTLRGGLMLLLAMINAVAAEQLHNNNRDKLLFHLFVALAVSFITLAAPMQFNGHSITLFWATEAVLLLWLFRKSGVHVFYFGSLILLIFTLISTTTLHSLQGQIYGGADATIRAIDGHIFINRWFITRLYASLAFIVAGWLLKDCLSKRTNDMENSRILPAWLPVAATLVAVVMLFYTGNRELYMYTHTSSTVFWRMAYFLVFSCILSFVIGRRATDNPLKLTISVALWTAACLSYWWISGPLYDGLLVLASQPAPYALHLVLYWVGFAALCGLFAAVIRIFYRQHPLQSSPGNTMTWMVNIAGIITMSIASVFFFKQLYLGSDEPFAGKAIVTVVWSLCAFAQMWMGMHLKYRTLRIISLTLLGLALVKLFMYDLSNVSQGAKIIAFVVLGVVLLVLSFLYQKLKKILFEDE